MVVQKQRYAGRGVLARSVEQLEVKYDSCQGEGEVFHPPNDRQEVVDLQLGRLHLDEVELPARMADPTGGCSWNLVRGLGSKNCPPIASEAVMASEEEVALREGVLFERVIINHTNKTYDTTCTYTKLKMQSSL